MKKIFLVLFIFLSLGATHVCAQQGQDPAVAMARMKERIKPQLMEKTKLTEAQADRIIEISFEQQRQRRAIRNDQALTEEEKRKRTEDLDTARDKKFIEIPLSPEQVKEVNEFFVEMRKNAPPRNQ